MGKFGNGMGFEPGHFVGSYDGNKCRLLREKFYLQHSLNLRIDAHLCLKYEGGRISI